MKTPLAAVLLLFPVLTNAQSYLCVADAAAAVKDREDQIATAGVVDAAGMSFVLTKADGRWGVKKLGSDWVFLDTCEVDENEPSYCEHDPSSQQYGGFFLMGPAPRRRFTALYVTKAENDPDSNAFVLSKGRCSVIEP
jgi:hypothetical protein